MHELSIASAILEIALRHGAGRRVTRVGVKVGHLRQVVPSALAFSFEIVAHGTAAEGARLDLETVPAVGRCRACRAESPLRAFPLQCAACGGFDLEIVAGDELLVESLDVLDAEEDGVGAYSD